MPKSHYEWEPGKPPPKLGPHSGAKHRVFADYIESYIRILSAMPARRELNLTVVDGFCGGGVYLGANGDLVPGSPLILVRAVKAAEATLAIERQHGFQVKADYFFIDKSKNHIDFLREEFAKSEFAEELGRTIHIQQGEFEKTAPAIVDAIKAKGPSNRALFFLDQYGWSAVSFATIRQIFSSLKNPEVLLTFSVDALINYFSERTGGMVAAQAIDIDPQFAEALRDLKNERAGRHVIQGFLYKHIIQATGADHYTPFFIKSPNSGRSYWLVHLSRHVRARDEMAQLHWRTSNTFVHGGKAGFSALGFDPSVDSNQQAFEFDFGGDARAASLNAAIDQLPGIIRGMGERGSSFTLGEVFGEQSNETPLTMPLVAEATARLRDDFKEVEILSSEGRDRPTALKLGWKDRVRLSTQPSFLRQIKIEP